MIEAEDYRLPKQEQQKPKPKADPATLSYLEALPWQPFDVEW
jgi:hypothetical protein